MNHIKAYGDFLNESKNVGVVYHYTTVKGLRGILEDDAMYSGHQHISFSRNADLKVWYENYRSFCRIAFDGNRLSNKFHIEPYMFDPSTDPLFGGGTEMSIETRRTYYRQEMEERIKKEEIYGVKKYIIQIDVLRSKSKDEEDIKVQEIMRDFPDINIQYVDRFTPVKS